MPYYSRRRRHNPLGSRIPPPKANGPVVNVDIDTLLRGSSTGSSLSHRALTTTQLTAWISSPRRGRNIITLYDGRSKVERLDAGRIVIITYETWGWRIGTSATAEPTPMLLCQGTMPGTGDKIAESGGMTLYQTPTSMLAAARYQATKGRRSFALAMIDEAIALKGRTATDEQINNITAKYKVFCALSATALSGSNSDSENLIEAASNEARTAFPHAVNRGAKIIEGEWS